LIASGGAVGLRSSGAFSSADVPRPSELASSGDDNALLGLDGLGSKVYSSPHTVTVTNFTDSPLNDNEVTSLSRKFRFREPGTSNNSKSLTIDTLGSGKSDSFEVVTGPNDSGNVTDTISLELSGPDEIDIEVERNLTVNAKSGGQLVYAVNKGDIRVYDAVNDAEQDPPEFTPSGNNPKPIKADIIGANAANIKGDDNADIPYLNKSENSVYTTDVGGGTYEIPKGNKPKLKKQKTRVALRKWPPASLPQDPENPENLLLFADNNASKIIAIDSDGNDEVIANPSNGCGGVAGVADIDCDGEDEMVFVDSSQQMRYLNQDGTTTKIQNGGVGSNNSTGFGPPADLDGDGIIEIPFIDGSQNPAIVTAGGKKTLLDSSGIAKKAAITPVDIDDDGELEFAFLGNSSGEIKYIEDIGETNTVKTLTVNGSSVIPLTKVGLNSGIDPDGQLSSSDCSPVDFIKPVVSQGVNTQSSQIQFVIENTGPDSITLDGFSVDAGNINSGIWIDDGNNSEFTTSGATTDGSADDPDRKKDSFIADGTTYSLGQNIELAATDDSVTVTFKAFGPDNKWISDSTGLEFVDDKSSADVIITFRSSDGNNIELYLSKV
jgi:hypothetical protein